MDVEMPPPQNSPKHILNALNDDCIQSIFRRLDNVRDFLSAAETCMRFQENAKLIFRAQYRKIQFCGLLLNIDNAVTYDRLRSLLSIFGHLIVDISFDRAIPDDILNIIADYCGKTLTTLKISSYSSFESVVNFKTRSSFQALEELQIRDANVQNFEYHTQLRRLFIKGELITDFDWLIQPFPQLESVAFLCVHQLRFEQAVEFLKLNPQLKSLCIRFCKQITPHIYESIANIAPNIEKLFFELHDVDGKCLPHITKLRNLKTLYLSTTFTWKYTAVSRLIDSLIENNTPVEVLGILNFASAEFATSELNILQLKQLKKLCLTQMTDKTLIDYVKHLPALEVMVCVKKLRLRESCPKLITMSGIKKALKYGKHLSVLSVDMIEMTIDSNDFKSVLDLAKQSLVKVTIANCYGTINVPKELLEANRKWLDVHTKRSLLYLNPKYKFDMFGYF